MPARGPQYEEGHLFVAAVRVLAHREGRPPTVEEIAELLGDSREIAYHLARGLAEKGVLRLLANPFETHVEVADHLALEELSREEHGPGFEEDLREFQERKKKDRDEMSDFFMGDGREKKKKDKLSKMEEEFRKFRKSKDSGDD
ncbi:MAG: hypothetical protein FJY73_13755 [Candidatus Eisenbacteria bacterium]|nr:hypothetical protein [Candidatus Eisenbacteria bacterium]